MTDDAELINAIRRDSESGFRILMKEKMGNCVLAYPASGDTSF